MTVSYLVSKDGQQLGPWTAEQVNAQLAGGMLEPTDLGWAEGFQAWMPLNQIEGLLMPGTRVAPATATVSMEAVADVPGLVTAGEAEQMAPRGRRLWLVAVILLAVGGLGAYQFVFGQGDLASLCSVLVEIIVPEKSAAPSNIAVPPHVQKYQNAAQAAQSRKAPVDEVNAQLDLRGDYHFTRGVTGGGLTAETGQWMNQFSSSTAKTPKAKGMVALARDALQSKDGVGAIDAYGMSSVFVKAGQFRHTAMVHHPTNAPGRVWQVLDNNGSALNGLRLMPPDTVLAMHGRVNAQAMRQWFDELGPSKPLTDALESLKQELPLDALLDSWTGEAGLFLSVNNTKFRTGDGNTELGKPSLLLVLGVKDGALEKILGQQLNEWQEPARTVKVNNQDVPLRVYDKLDVPEEISRLDVVPSIGQSGKYLVLSLSFKDSTAVEALNRNATTRTGLMGGTADWAALLEQSQSRLNVPNSNFIFFVAPNYRAELAKWEKLKLWNDVPPGFANALKALAGSEQDKGMHATVQARANGVLFKARVQGSTSKQTFARVKTTTQAFVVELIPQVAMLAEEQWSKLDLPGTTPPSPEPETPESADD